MKLAFFGHTGMLVVLRLDDPESEGRVDQVQFGDGLLDEFIPVGQDEGPAAAPLDQEGKHNGFACACGQHEQRALYATRRGGEQGRDRFILVRPGREPECGRRLGNSLHPVCSQANDDGH